MSTDLPIAVILAALAKTLDEIAPQSKQQFFSNMKEMTLEDLAEALVIVKNCRGYKNTPEEIERDCLREAKTFFGIEDF